MKVLYILQDPNFFSGRSHVIGGHISHVIGVIESFMKLGYEVVIKSFDPIPYWYQNGARYTFLRTFEMPFSLGSGFVRQLQVTFQIITTILKEKPDIVYLRWSANIFFYFARWALPGAQIVVECNTPLEMSSSKKGTKHLKKWLSKRIDNCYVNTATLISTVSEVTRGYLLKRHPSLDHRRVIVNPNGVDNKRFQYIHHNNIRDLYGIPNDYIVIGWAGNFSYYHRTDLLIKAFQMLDIDNGHLMIIGTGQISYEKSYRSLANRYRSSQILFTGPVPFDQMPEYLSACDILVCSQGTSIEDRFHGSPTKLFEYMAVGRAIIASRIGQIQNVIKHGHNGLLFEPGSIEDLKGMLKKLVYDESLREELGLRARKDVKKNYTWEANVTRILSRLRSL